MVLESDRRQRRRSDSNDRKDKNRRSRSRSRSPIRSRPRRARSSERRRSPPKQTQDSRRDRTSYSRDRKVDDRLRDQERKRPAPPDETQKFAGKTKDEQREKERDRPKSDKFSSNERRAPPTSEDKPNDLSARLGSYYQRFQERLGDSDRDFRGGRYSQRGPRRSRIAFRPLVAPRRPPQSMGGDIPGRFGEATEDESNVVRLFDPRSVPQGKSYFEHDDRARGGPRGGGFRRRGGGFRGRTTYRDRREAGAEGLWSHDLFQEPDEAEDAQ